MRLRCRRRDTVGAGLGVDPREADLTPARDLVRATRGGDASGDWASPAAARFTGTRRAEASGWLLALALLVGLAELGVATRMSG
jgi:hypothetical protein